MRSRSDTHKKKRKQIGVENTNIPRVFSEEQYSHIADTRPELCVALDK
jgi:hypothetical protein